MKQTLFLHSERALEWKSGKLNFLHGFVLPCYVTLGKSLSSWGLSFPICKMSSLKWMVSKDPKSGILRFLFPPCGG